ncbi:MAG TPA: valine--tRNA ligase [Candidatus Acidoferrales bacterium]|nr:valine--tRNA ligase [Candidatus Acidoferrales bacterium]
MAELNKTYDPAAVEDKWYSFWEAEGYFFADETRPGPRFSIVIPPPNITGVLTMGHVLNNSLQDVLVRFKRMDGFVTLWLPGTDHAGIATQNVVEKQLATEGLSRHDLGREEFEKRVWAWKERYGSTILLQLKKLGSSCDWRRERFTMDPGLSQAVREVFVRLYEKGLIYRGQRIIHWCPRCQTALSDEEAITTEGGETGHLWHIRYPAEDGGEGVVVATTRPETMLGDTGVAVHPDDARYRPLIGKRVILPLMERPIPVIADALVDPAFGTGAVKVTPAHDANDFEMGQRHGLAPLVIMGTDGRVNENGGRYAGMDRFAARKQIVADLEARGLLVKADPYRVPVRRCERCNTVIEPYLSEQWFVRMTPLAQPAIAAVRDGELRLYPERWVGVYLHWMENIRDWCISRQLWWGHRIPVWYCEACGERTVARTDPTACAHCGSTRIRQDIDVLDTWFSSWLWPFSTMGWPDDTPTLRRFYPTDALVTAADIIFFWVARMVMAGYEFMGERPFSEVCFNSVVRDLQGRKMSKSLGNSPDPLDVIRDYGADALRFTIISLAPPGEDVRYAVEKTDLGRHFANKIWNAARFVLMNVDTPQVAPLASLTDLSLPDRWILSRLQSVIDDVRAAFTAYRFNDGALALYQFIWHEYCDWYVELVKLPLYGTDVSSKRRVQTVLVHTLEHALRLLHPFMPFVTEEIWQALPAAKTTESIMIAPYPTADAAWRDAAAEAAVAQLIDAVRSVRNIRSELGIPPNTALSVRLAADGRRDQVSFIEPYMKALAKVDGVEVLAAGQRPAGEPSALVEGLGEVFVPLRGVVDPGEVRKRLERDLAKVEKELSGVEAKLSRADFIDKAPADIVDKERRRAATLRERKGTLDRHLAVLSASA